MRPCVTNRAWHPIGSFSQHTFGFSSFSMPQAFSSHYQLPAWIMLQVTWFFDIDGAKAVTKKLGHL